MFVVSLCGVRVANVPVSVAISVCCAAVIAIGIGVYRDDKLIGYRKWIEFAAYCIASIVMWLITLFAVIVLTFLLVGIGIAGIDEIQ